MDPGPESRPVVTGIMTDASRFKRRLIVSITGQNFAPGDRLQRVEVTLRMQDPKFVKFVSWDKFVTRYDTVDLGDLKLTQSSEVSGSARLSPTVINALSSAGVDASASTSLAESLVLKHKLNAMSGQLGDDWLRLTTEGEIGIDLTGNLAMDVDLQGVSTATAETPVFRFGGLRKPDGTPGASDAVTVDERFVKVIANPGPAKALVSARYVIRHVLSGAETIMEGDDRVCMVDGAVGQEGGDSVLLAPADLLASFVFALKISAPETPKDARFLHVYDAPGKVVMLETYEAALDLRNWLRDTFPSGTIAKIGKKPVSLGGGVPLDAADVNQLMIVRLPAR
jgi:hypothetical protein